jgi:hypothetical protein
MKQSQDRIKFHRTILLEYIGDNYDKDKYQVYQRPDGWEPVRRALRNLCKDEGIRIQLDQYPKTKLITVTLVP